MCGIAGFILKQDRPYSVKIVEDLLSAIEPRGPDDQGILLISRFQERQFNLSTEKTAPEIRDNFGFYKNAQIIISADVGLLHTRYSILDLTFKGHQPFFTQDKSIAVIFNGEIYNFIELKALLIREGIFFRTHCDTEVLAEGYRLWGDELWAKLNGFWAIAVYDFRTADIILSRDRIGVAPLYYRQMPDGLYFASTIQSLINIDPASLTLNDDVFYGFIETGLKDYDHGTYYKEIKSLPPATIFRFSKGQAHIGEAKSYPYWKLPAERLTEKDISFSEAVKDFRQTFFNAVSIRLRADVPVAFELSGGLDSSSVVAAAMQMHRPAVTAYTLKIKGADEEGYARAMLSLYKFNYKPLSDIEDHFSDEFEKFNRIMEEPYDNPNAYTHHQMLRLMKKEGTYVVITGSGGDEVLCGYEAEFWPKAYAELKAKGGLSYWHADWYEFRRRFRTAKSAYETLLHYGRDSFKFLFKKASSKAQTEEAARTQAEKYRAMYRQLSFHEQSLFHFNVGLLPFYMRSSDHFTMGIPIEHRFPFLDYRLIEFGLKLPISYLFKNGWTKYILRKAMEPYLPAKILWRKKKMGFDFPFSTYFTEQKTRFEPWFGQIPGQEQASYDDISRQNPEKLWRIISSAVWLKQSPVQLHKE